MLLYSIYNAQFRSLGRFRLRVPEEPLLVSRLINQCRWLNNLADVTRLVLNHDVATSIVLLRAILSTASRLRIALIGTVIVGQGCMVRRLDVLRVELYLIEPMLHWLCFVVESLVCVLG